MIILNPLEGSVSDTFHDYGIASGEGVYAVILKANGDNLDVGSGSFARHDSEYSVCYMGTGHGEQIQFTQGEGVDAILFGCVSGDALTVEIEDAEYITPSDNFLLVDFGKHGDFIIRAVTNSGSSRMPTLVRNTPTYPGRGVAGAVSVF